ncbi:MAG: NAD-dependent succinate-semialdehyde dehydrogenase [Pseudomonadota bacterium]
MQLADPSLFKTQSYIDGAWIGGADTPVINPANGAEVARVPELGAAEATSAVEAAGVAFKTWSKTTAKERFKLLRAWFDLMIAHKDDLGQIMTAEQGKPLAEAKGEIDYAASFVEFYAEEAKRIYGETIPAHKADARIMVIRQPIGVVAAITPWNFPAAMITRKLAPALAAGCTAVCKPAPETPLTALALAELAHRAGIPKGVFNIITGDAPAIGGVMTSHPLVRVVGFTGSTEVGKLLMRQSASTVKRVALELGGNAPFIVFDDADLDSAIQGAMLSKFRNAGQTCVCANRIYVQSGVYDAFAEKFASEAMALKVGDGTDVGVTTGPLINADAVAKVDSHIKDAVGMGAEVVTGGKPHALGGNFYEPTVLKNVTTRMLITREETFGPVAPLFKFDTEDEVVAMANDTPAGLAAYFYSRDVGRCFRVAEALEYGIVGVNEGIISTEVAPFGGVKESGLGREGSHHGIEEFVELKYILMGGLAQ